MKKISLNLIFLLTTFFSVSAISIFSQTPTSTPPAVEDKDVVKISTTLIQVDATVLDKTARLSKD